MKIILSVQSIKYPLTGIGRYTFELGRRLQQSDAVEMLKFYDGEKIVETLPIAADQPELPRVDQSVFNKAKRLVARNKLVVNLYQGLKSISDKRVFAGQDEFLFHGTNFYIPEFSGKSAVTIHDLSILTMPEFHPPERVQFLGKAIEASVSRTSVLIADSEYVKTEIVNRWHIPASRVGVAKLACGEEFKPRTEADTYETLKKYGLNYDSYVFYAGTIEPRKNLSNLIEAFSRLPEQARQRCPLVLAGYKGWNNQDIMEKIAKGQRQGWLKHLGYVLGSELPHLYSGARLFTFPSHYEGFGLPVLEAMASGVPVLASCRSSLPEVGGDAALYVEPLDIEGMTNGISKGIDDDAWRAVAKMRGIKQAKQFSWEQCAAETLAIYRQATNCC